MKFYLIFFTNLKWAIYCSDDIMSFDSDERFFYQEIDYEELIHNIDFVNLYK